MCIEILESRIAPAAFLVTTTADYGPGSLRSAIGAADAIGAGNSANGAPANTNGIIFAPWVHGTITLQSPLPVITASMTIGEITHARITIDGQSSFQIFNINGASKSQPINVDINDLTLTHGVSQTGGGALYINDPSGTVKLAGCTITKNQDVAASGFVGAPQAGIGGAIDLSAGTLDITSSKLSGNIAVGSSAADGGVGGNGLGGAIYVGNAGILVMASCTVAKNSAEGGQGGSAGSGQGGGICSNGNLTITSSTISGNLAVGGGGVTEGASGGNGLGGGIYAGKSAKVIMTNCTVAKNSAIGGNGIAGTDGDSGAPSSVGAPGGQGGSGGSARGGGICSYGNLTIASSTISGNLALGGKAGSGGAGGQGIEGGIGGNGGIARASFGGGIYSTGVLTLKYSTVSGNVVISGAGGSGGAGALGMPAGKAAANTFGYGGGIDSANSTITLIECTVAKNVAGQGGGLFISRDTSATLDNSTIAFNTARNAGEGGGLWVQLDTNKDPVTVASTVIGQNTTGPGGHGADLYMSSGAIAASHSLIESFTAGSVSDPSDPINTDIENLSPLLHHLAANGGPTLTCLPNSTQSPLLGAGSNPQKLTRDQRGHVRTIFGTLDIGAVEVT